VSNQEFDLLPHLEVLLGTRSVTAAAERQGLSVPAMSRILGKLRERLGDPLLVRAGNGMVLTPRAVQLRRELAPALRQVRRLMLAGTAERPALDRPFRLRTSDAVPCLLAQPLLLELERRVEGAALTFVSEGEENVDALRDGDVDLDIGVQDDDSAELMVQGLFDETLVVVAGADHPLRDDPLDLDRFCSFPQIAVSRKGAAFGPLDAALAGHDLRRQVVFVVAGYLDAALLVSQGRYLGLLPQRLALQLAPRLGLEVLAPPLPLPKLRVAQAWHRRMQDDPAHRALRQAVARVAERYRTS
jgi:DNA-binding transcriptional LysR family regulator